MKPKRFQPLNSRLRSPGKQLEIWFSKQIRCQVIVLHSLRPSTQGPAVEKERYPCTFNPVKQKVTKGYKKYGSKVSCHWGGILCTCFLCSSCITPKHRTMGLHGSLRNSWYEIPGLRAAPRATKTFGISSYWTKGSDFAFQVTQSSGNWRWKASATYRETCRIVKRTHGKHIPNYGVYWVHATKSNDIEVHWSHWNFSPWPFYTDPMLHPNLPKRPELFHLEALPQMLPRRIGRSNISKDIVYWPLSH